MSYALVFWIHFYFLSLQILFIKPDEKKHLGIFGSNWNSVLKWMFEVIQPGP